MLLAEVQACVDAYAMFSPGENMIVAVSGGADSIALLFALFQLRSVYNLTLIVAHVNHQLRGVEAERDALFVEQQAQRLGVPFYWTRVDVQALQRHSGLSLHPAARQLRYRFFQALSHKLDATRIALGHTADDQAETLLMRLLRGSGSAGLSGMPAVRLPFIRPLITVSRDTILAYLQDEGLAWIEDSSNTQMTYLRNRVRQDLLPKLRLYNPRIVNRLNELAGLLRDENHLLEAQVDAWAERLVKEPMAYRRQIPCILLRSAPIAIQRRLLRRVLESLASTSDGLGFRHVEGLRQLIVSGERGQYRIFPGHVVAAHHGDTVMLWNTQRVPELPVDMVLPVPGRVDIAALNVRLSAEVMALSTPTRFRLDNANEAWLDLDRIACPLSVRFWQPGDRFSPLGGSGSKKLHDFFVDTKIPRAERPYVPLVVSRQVVVWVVGYRMTDLCKLGPTTRRVLRLQSRVLQTIDARREENRG